MGYSFLLYHDDNIEVKGFFMAINVSWFLPGKIGSLEVRTGTYIGLNRLACVTRRDSENLR